MRYVADEGYSEKTGFKDLALIVFLRKLTEQTKERDVAEESSAKAVMKAYFRLLVGD